MFRDHCQDVSYMYCVLLFDARLHALCSRMQMQNKRNIAIGPAAKHTHTHQSRNTKQWLKFITSSEMHINLNWSRSQWRQPKPKIDTGSAREGERLWLKEQWGQWILRIKQICYKLFRTHVRIRLRFFLLSSRQRAKNRDPMRMYCFRWILCLFLPLFVALNSELDASSTSEYCTECAE